MMNRYFVLLLAVGILLQDATNAFAEGTGIGASGMQQSRHVRCRFGDGVIMPRSTTWKCCI
jgi:hypothetical protein